MIEMTRIQKYRVYSEETKMMYYSHRPDGSDNPLWSWDAVFRNQLVDSTDHKEQFTGLHDRNGNDIYEGDIIDDGDAYESGYLVVKWVDWSSGFLLIAPDEYLDFCDYSLSTIVVVGNIHQNPELLEVKQ